MHDCLDLDCALRGLHCPACTASVGGERHGWAGSGFAVCREAHEQLETRIRRRLHCHLSISLFGYPSAVVQLLASLTKLRAEYNGLGGEGKAVLRKAVEGRSGFELKL